MAGGDRHRRRGAGRVHRPRRAGGSGAPRQPAEHALDPRSHDRGVQPTCGPRRLPARADRRGHWRLSRIPTSVWPLTHPHGGSAIKR